MKKILRLFCRHQWRMDRKITGQPLFQCYCEKCYKIKIIKLGIDGIEY